MKKFKININYEKEVTVDKGTTFKEVVDDNIPNDEIVICTFNGDSYELGAKIPSSGDLSVIKASTDEGWKIYSRTLQYIFIKAALDVFPDAKIKIEHSISKGIFGEVIKDGGLTKEDVRLIKDEMIDLINRDIEIKKIEVTKEKAINIFKDYKMFDKVKLLEQMDFVNVHLY